jgi:hypothetical protein
MATWIGGTLCSTPRAFRYTALARAFRPIRVFHIHTILSRKHPIYRISHVIGNQTWKMMALQKNPENVENRRSSKSP